MYAHVMSDIYVIHDDKPIIMVNVVNVGSVVCYYSFYCMHTNCKVFFQNYCTVKCNNIMDGNIHFVWVPK